MRPIPCIPEKAPFTPEQRAWINGFLAGLFSDANTPANSNNTDLSINETQPEPLLILFGSQTGTGEALARRLSGEAARRRFAPRVLDMNAFANIRWKDETRLLIVTSTWGDGDPPDNAVGFWNFLNSNAAPNLGHLNFSVLALGDRNYSSFCGAGRKFDEQLEKLGANRIHPRADCDVDYEAAANAWIEAALKSLLECGSSSSTTDVAGHSDTSLKLISDSLPSHSDGSPTNYNRQNPFPARLLANRRLNSNGSAKDTRHFEISLEGSGLKYEVGDALGVVPRNSPALVEEILAALKCDGEEAVKNGGPAEMPLRKALLEHFEIRQVSKGLLEAIADRTADSNLRGLLTNKSALDDFLHGREVIDLLLVHPNAVFSPAEFVSFLRKLNPRLYSISSSIKAHPEEVHLTVAAVRYEAHGRKREGVCSTFLADRVNAETPVQIFIQPSHFRLPRNSDTPVIMIGPGTGVAPFRAFLEERRAMGARGLNWLFFGDQRRDSDFLYRAELEPMLSDGHLTFLDTAFSRDQAEKIYVQHRMLENAAKFWSWLEEGAHIYVCGDAKRMAKDVEAALHEIIQTAGARTADQAADYVQKMKTEKRYQRDVY